MLKIIVPIAIMFAIALIPKIPKIGGNIAVALAVGGALSLIMNGIFNPKDWLEACISGLDSMGYLLLLTLFGGLFAQAQKRIGAMEGIVKVLRALFGRSSYGLILAIMIALCIAGALMGASSPCIAVIGVLVVPSLLDLGLNINQIAATLIMGAAIGSIMPPVTQAIYLSCTLLSIDPADVVGLGYITVGICFVIVTIYVCRFFVGSKKLDPSLIPEESAGKILKKYAVTLIPVMTLLLLVVLNNGFKIDLVTMLLKPFFTAVKKVRVIKAFSNVIACSIFLCFLLCFFYKNARQNVGAIFKDAGKSLKNVMLINLACAFMVGCFGVSGMTNAVKELALGLDVNAMKLGGAVCMALVGMLTGTQSGAQNTVFTFLGPALVDSGVAPTHAAIAGSHIAAAAQGMPPADSVTFACCGILGGLVPKEKPNPLKIMFMCAPFWLYLFLCGVLFMYI